MRPEEFVELCAKLKKLGVQGFKFEGCEAAFYPPEPELPALSELSPKGLEEEDDGTAAGRREMIRRQIAQDSQDLYGSSG